MSYSEFAKELVPSVLELQNECEKMTEGEFESFREEYLKEVRKMNNELCTRFVSEVLNMVHENVFGMKKQKTA